ncbi:hypothetical protein RFI_15682 [Reticulomyxa filosa]|uniref:Uncharacterized protein n=1 Tax=Reticulomyxa filosa TaxID=46433 RepID=X6N671_RETFI|nr:hypothetical protein RFI_15682 [Reticulomyxa filosa]|eukprot:ETO21521.1 hypothetical protein RFI_15682 [Reticulomyxa filosa]
MSNDNGSDALIDDFSDEDEKQNESGKLLDLPDTQKQFFRALDAPWTVSETFTYVFLVISTSGVGLLAKSIFDFEIKKERIKRVNVNNVTCDLNASFMDYLFDVYLPTVGYNVVTLGCYSLFGYAKERENNWFDQKIKFKLLSKL